MPTAIDRIRSKNKIAASPAAVTERPASNAFTRNLPAMTPVIIAAAAPNVGANLDLPPPIPCLFCGCPAIWFSIYEPAVARCCDCEPPPGGNDAWHFERGGWAFVSRRLMIVVDQHTTTLADIWHWESFPRIDWRKELAAVMAVAPVATSAVAVTPITPVTAF